MSHIDATNPAAGFPTPIDADSLELIAAQPIERLQIGQIDYTLLGTAHVSKASADAVRILMAQESFDAIAIELDQGRYQALLDPDAYQRLDLFEIIKNNKVGLVAANLALGAYQRRIAQESGVEPGAEMLAAIQGAKAQNLPLWLVDREVGLTLARCRAALGFWGGTKLMTSLALGSFNDDKVQTEDIEKLKQSDLLHATFSEFEQDSPALFEALIAERDRFMAAKLRASATVFGNATETTNRKKVLVVIGAGHLAGTAVALSTSKIEPEQEIAVLNQKPKPSIWPKLIGWGFITFLVAGLLYGFSKGFAVGQEFLMIYLGVTAGGTLIGALFALASPLSAIAAALAAPITVLHPAISSGMVAAAVELWLKRPTIKDFEALKVDLNKISGFWTNRVARILTIFFLTSLGTSIAVWITTAVFIGKL
jgi:pheromone shutdown-related protein TraB